MTIALDAPPRLLTVADWEAMPEDTDQHWELLEGVPVLMAKPTFDHNRLARRLANVLEAAAGDDLAVGTDNDVNLLLVPDTEPGTVRAPDVLVITAAEHERVRRERGFLRADGLVLAVEIVSPGSRRTDRILKQADYADAGIPNYWIVDLDDGPSLLANRLVGDRYEAFEPVRGTWRTETPFRVDIDLSALI